MPTEKSDTERARDAELETTFLRAFNLVDELTDIQRNTMHGANATLTWDQLTRFSTMFSFCAGYAAGAAGILPNHWRKVLVDGGES